MKFIAVLVVFLCILPFVAALSGHVPLLALTELPNTTRTGVATELMLDVRSGSERVFLETLPLTQITTQISMRFAQQIACREFDLSCENKDFFFAIKTLPGPIVGGPSAGAAATILVAATLQNVSVNPRVAMTGTINSGGLIGPVGGLKEKIGAAAAAGYTTVLIPVGTRFQKKKLFDGEADLVVYGESINVTVKEVATIREAYGFFTGVPQKNRNATLILESAYATLMRTIAQQLCSRTASLKSKIEKQDDVKQEILTNITVQAAEALVVNASYSAASFCFRGNLLAKELINIQGNKSVNKTRDLAVFESQLLYWEDYLQKEPIQTITDVQTYIAVQERLNEAREGLEEAKKTDKELEGKRLLSYSEERLVSARAWSAFFNLTDKNGLKVTSDALKKTCVSRVGEAEERYNYVKTILPETLKNTRQTLDHAYEEYQKEKYISCIGSASKAKAEADVVLSVVGVDEERLQDIFAIKKEIVKQQLLRAQEEGVFPIIGYSYYEYAQALASVDLPSALLFSEYALELSDLSIYFKKPSKKISLAVSVQGYSLGLGFLIGILCTAVFYSIKYKGTLRKRK